MPKYIICHYIIRVVLVVLFIYYVTQIQKYPISIESILQVQGKYFDLYEFLLYLRHLSRWMLRYRSGTEVWHTGQVCFSTCRLLSKLWARDSLILDPILVLGFASFLVRDFESFLVPELDVASTLAFAPAPALAPESVFAECSPVFLSKVSVFFIGLSSFFMRSSHSWGAVVVLMLDEFSISSWTISKSEHISTDSSLIGRSLGFFQSAPAPPAPGLFSNDSDETNPV